MRDKIVRIAIPTIVLLMWASNLLAHPADSLWMRTFGTDGADGGYAVCQTSDGGFVVAGESRGDIYLVRTDNRGGQIWAKTFGGAGYEVGHSVVQPAEGEFVVAGYTESSGPGSKAMFLLKTAANGDSLWFRTYGGNGSDGAYSVDRTMDGGYILAGFTGSFGAGGFDAYLVKTDSHGDTVWTRSYGGVKGEDARSVQQTSDGGYIFAGKTKSFGSGGDDFYLVKTDSAGNPQWERTYGGYKDDAARSVREIRSGGYVVAGYSYSFRPGDIDGYVITTNSAGNLVRSMTSDWPDPDYFESVWPTDDGGYIITGTFLFLWQPDLYLVKTSDRLGIQWTRTYGLSWTYKDDNGRCVRQIADGSYIICGNTWSYGAGGSDVFLIRTVKTGDRVPPDPPVMFDVTASEGQVTLRWTNSMSPDAIGTHIRYHTTTYPGSPIGGWPVPNSNEGRFGGTPCSDSSFIHTDLDEGRTYYYSAFAYDLHGNHSDPARAKVTIPIPDRTPPDLEIAVYQRPDHPDEIEVYLVSSESLDSASVTLRIDEEEVPISPSDPFIWTRAYGLSNSDEVISLVGHGADAAGNDTTVTGLLGHAYFAADPRGRVSSPDGVVTIRIAPGALDRGGHVIVIPCRNTGGNTGAIQSLARAAQFWTIVTDEMAADSYRISPCSFLGSGEAYLEWRFSKSDVGPEVWPDQLYIEHDRSNPLDSFVYPDESLVGVVIKQLGDFRLRTGRRGMSCMANPDFLNVGLASPNPFDGHVTFTFDIRSLQYVHAAIYDVRGRLVNHLLDKTAYPGSHTVTWNGRSLNGSKASSGVYMATVRTDSRVTATKILVAR